ncbi:MAG: UvrD-helicase domain-containing protein [Candidatus Nanopelagicales bacterium]
MSVQPTLSGSAVPTPFDITGPLPTGTLLLEASAGTGKTFAIAGLATRYVAEGVVPLDRLLMITFSRAATRELRERVRLALTRARDALLDPAGIRPGDDLVIDHLAAASGAEVAERARRLSDAVANFDAAAIATTHQFCNQMLDSLGLSAGRGAGERFTEDISELVGQVVDDFYIRKYAPPDSAGYQLPIAIARKLAGEVCADPRAEVYLPPVGAPVSPADEIRIRFTRNVRAEVDRRRSVAGLVTFDDLVNRLAAALDHPATGAAAVAQMRERFSVALVDEFQDTDALQWRILERAFHGHRTLVLIGDPKQAIYGFRGGDIACYLAASERATIHATLAVNYRSDAPVVAGLGALFAGIELGSPRIAAQPVQAARQYSRLRGRAGTAPPPAVRLRVPPVAEDRLPAVAAVREAVIADVVADVSLLLAGVDLVQVGLGSSPATAPTRPLNPGDIAVLVPRNSLAEQIREALSAVGIPGVVNGTTSVFATPAADMWRTLLAAVDEPRAEHLQALALSDFCGYTARDLVEQGDQLTSQVGAQVRDWAIALSSGSVAQLAAGLDRDTGLTARLLARPSGERLLTDFRHIATSLHAYARDTRAGSGALRESLAEQVRQAAEAPRERVTDRTRRLDTDAEAVQILTVHSAKGQEFPIVYVPFGWDRFSGGDSPEVLRVHADGRRQLDVRLPGAARAEHLRIHQSEQSGEDLRTLYVAATRGASMVVLHWAATIRNTAAGPLHRILSARAQAVSDPAPTYRVGRDLPSAGLGAAVAVEQMLSREVRPWRSEPERHPKLTTAPYARRVDTNWRRTSYTGLTSALHDRPETAPEELRQDEPETAADPAGPSAFSDRRPESRVTEPASSAAGVESSLVISPFADFPSGAAFGTLVHAALEEIDTAAGDLPAEVLRVCQECLVQNQVEGVAASELAEALLATLRTPLGPLAAEVTLADIRPADRLPELTFELPLGPGAGTADLSPPLTPVRDIAELMAAHLPSEDPLAGYPARLAGAIGDSALAGFLTGSIDAVVRLGPPEEQRYVVVDYKTNWLGGFPPADGVLTVHPYLPEFLPDAMIEAHYPLQAILYSVALHRYLRWRVPAYDPARHLGGVLYLYLRGMCGESTPRVDGHPAGVFSWSPPAGLVVALSDLLAGARP